MEGKNVFCGSMILFGDFRIQDFLRGPKLLIFFPDIPLYTSVDQNCLGDFGLEDSWNPEKR